MKHIGNLERKAEIRAAFRDLKILESQYGVCAGFNEALIQSGFGYLEEIHVFCRVEIPNSSFLLTKLGKVLTPYPGFVFTPSSGYKTPVFKDDGTIWDYHDLSLHRTERHSDIRANGILQSELNAFTSLAESQPAISVTALGRSEGGGNGGRGGTGEDKGQGRSVGHNDHRERNNDPGDGPGDSNSGGSDPDPDPGPAEKEDSSTPGISFEIQAKLFEGTRNSSSSRPFQELEINGTLVVQVSVLHLFLGKHKHLITNPDNSCSIEAETAFQISCRIQKAQFSR